MQHPTVIPPESMQSPVDVKGILKKTSAQKLLRLALFISGGGTTAEAILVACKTGRLAIDPVLVVASKAGIPGIERVKKAGIKNLDVNGIDPQTFRHSGKSSEVRRVQNRNDSLRDPGQGSMMEFTFGDTLLNLCKQYKIDLIGQYGWLPLTPKKLIQEYEGRIINQHPGPVDPPYPDFGGKGMWGRRVHAAVLLFRRMTNHDFWTEATCHFVTEEFDKGGVIKRKQVEILPSDTVEDVQKRLLLVEHEVQIDALQDFVDEKVKTQERTKPLIQKNELRILEEAKKIASMLYPGG